MENSKDKVDLSRLISRWGLLKTFAISSIISIVLTTSTSGFLLFSFLRTSMLSHDAKISTDLMQSISSFSDLENYFSGSSLPENEASLIDFFGRVMEMKDVHRVVAYDTNSKILWASDKRVVGKIFPDNHDLKRALTGEHIFKEEFTNFLGKDVREKIEHTYLPDHIRTFVESYIPILNQAQSKVIGVIELYKSPSDMYQSLNTGRIMVILFSFLSGITLFMLLFWVVKTAHNLIELQRDKISKANSRITEINEQYLRRIGSELHDGPAQSISYALLNLECVMLAISNCKPGDPRSSADYDFICEPQVQSEAVQKIQSVLTDSLQEIRDLSSGLVIPDLSQMSLKNALKKIVTKHQLRTSTKVTHNLDSVPMRLELAKKICLYRFTQEGLNNAYKHGNGVNQSILVSIIKDSLSLTISDSGPGYNLSDLHKFNDTEHLGLRGLRDRVEGLGGQFDISQHSGNNGFKITCTLPLE